MSRLFSGVAGRIATLSLGVGTAATMFQSCLFNVPPGHHAIKFDHWKGVRPDVYGEGTHLLVPLLQYPIIMDTRILPKSIVTQTGTKDLQMVNLSLRVLFRPKVEKLADIYTRLNINYHDLVLPSVVNEVLKAEVARYNADQLLTMRDQVSRQIRAAIVERLVDFNIILEDVAITHLFFSAEFAKSIEDKQVSEQMAERAKFIVMLKEQEAQALLIRSEGDATAAKIVGDSFRNFGTGLLEIRRIETAQEVASRLAASPNIVYLPNSGNMLLNLNGATGGK